MTVVDGSLQDVGVWRCVCLMKLRQLRVRELVSYESVQGRKVARETRPETRLPTRDLENSQDGIYTSDPTAPHCTTQED